MPNLPSRWSNAEGLPLRRRAGALVFTVLAHLLLIYLLIRLAPREFAPMGKNGSLMTFSVMPGPEPQKQSARQEQKQAAEQPQPAASRPAAATPPPPIVQMPVPLRMPDNFIELSRSDMANLDTALATKSEGRGQAVASANGGGDDTPSTMGPNGERLYAAEWYREPREVELSPYLPRGGPSGAWGEIACRTVARYHVEDCEELGDSFPGLGIARGMRQAAFQFLVRPPRVGGKSMVGTWVRIRITLTERPEVR